MVRATLCGFPCDTSLQRWASSQWLMWLRHEWEGVLSPLASGPCPPPPLKGMASSWISCVKAFRFATSLYKILTRLRDFFLNRRKPRTEGHRDELKITPQIWGGSGIRVQVSWLPCGSADFGPWSLRGLARRGQMGSAPALTVLLIYVYMCSDCVWT